MIDRVAAFHEAGHAVVATIYGFDVRLVQLHQIGTRADEQGRCELASWLQDVNTDPVRTLTYLFAGSAAEWCLTGLTSPRDASDRERAALLASLSICEVDDTQHPRVRATLASAEAMARALMCDAIVWRAVERVAAALQRKGVLSGRDVQLHLREARR